MKLQVDINENDPSIVVRMKARFVKEFNQNREKDIEEAIELANYMVTIGCLEQARDFLGGFIYTNPEMRSGDLWVVNGQGVVLLAYVYRLLGDNRKYCEHMRVLKSNDLWPSDIGKRKWIKMHLKDHLKKVEYAQSQSQKYKCAFLGQEILSFLYFYESLFVYDKTGFPLRLYKKDIKGALKESRELLLEALVNK